MDSGFGLIAAFQDCDWFDDCIVSNKGAVLHQAIESFVLVGHCEHFISFCVFCLFFEHVIQHWCVNVNHSDAKSRFSSLVGQSGDGRTHLNDKYGY